jgi:SAM-dependent methyltransferase
VSPEESQRLADEPVELAMLLRGDAAAGHVFLLHALYQSPARILGERCAPTVVANMQPEPLRDAVGQFLLTEEQERAKAIGVPRLGAILDVTSRQVAQQYEAYPYPRWTSAAAMREKEFRRALTGFFGHQRLSFLDAPFEVLIAGCGTGQHAVLSALEYAKHGRVLALDLSLASLGYAARMADHFGLTNIEFAQADLQDLHSTDARYASRYQVIECVGVLHHMSDPFKGWRSLLKCLAPGGIMRIGLYSAAARRSLTALRADPEYPGPGCDDTVLRTYRQKLMALEGEQGRELRSYFDFYATGPFRDLVLHVSERSFNLAEIERFMREENLVFRGFQLDKQRVDLFSRRFPTIWPGSLVQWAELEREWPDLFSAMYLFWCDKA